MQYSKNIATPSNATQSDFLPGQVPNSCGAAVYEADQWSTLRKFLVIGAEGGTYYVSQKSLIKENVTNLRECIKADGARVVKDILHVNLNNLSLKVDATIFALALVCKEGDQNARAAAYQAIPEICRTGTHLFQFCAELKGLERGWSRGLRTAVGRYYRENKNLELHLVKYRQRNGWTHQDVMRLSHPNPNGLTGERQELLRYAVGKGIPSSSPLVQAFEEVQNNKDMSASRLVSLVKEYRLPHEAIPDHFRKLPEVWDALLDDMGPTALIRNLNTLAVCGLTKSNLDNGTKRVVERLQQFDRDYLKAARVHPIRVLIASRMYNRGRGEKGSLTWTAVPAIMEQLDSLFYRAFDAVEPTGKNTLLALDISGSMSSEVMGSVLRSCEITAAFSMVQARVEPYAEIVGFSNKVIRLGITKNDTLESAIRKVVSNNFGSTDCSAAMRWAQDNRIPVDTFIVYTDCETNGYGSLQPAAALRQYRKQTGIDARLAVVATEARPFTLADPKDKGMLDVCGFSADVPTVLSEFALRNF